MSREGVPRSDVVVDRNSGEMMLAVVIPAFKPDSKLVNLVEALSAKPIAAIIIVNDGSGPEYEPCFQALKRSAKVHLLQHAVNLGKGAALKSGINYSLCAFPDHYGVVTADADGQHDPDDIVRVAKCLCANPGALVLGARTFSRTVPFRSRLGNGITRVVTYLLTGQRLADTQTGLRGIPHPLLVHLLKIPSTGYEFEAEMLIACKHNAYPIVQEVIRTIYIDGNASSHFNPLIDSLRIYFTLFRFSTISILTALLDNGVFCFVLLWSTSLALAQVAGRTLAVAFNYGANRNAVFLSHQRHRTLLPRYLLIVIVSGIASYALIRLLTSTLPITTVPAKISAELILFLFNFAVQRDFVFTEPDNVPRATNWNQYYSGVPVTAMVTRKYTSSVLIFTLRRVAKLGKHKIDCVAELGGANSCFLDQIVTKIEPTAYHVVDNNEFGLDLLRERTAGKNVLIHNENVLGLSLHIEADVAFSVGLIEHFDRLGTRQAILAHFDNLRVGGYAIISFPSPTLLYRIARFFAERLGLWKFPDERPLPRQEVIETILERGEIVYEKILWPLIFTQRLIVARNA